MKLSEVQREVLEYMVQGSRLLASTNGGSWLDNVSGRKGFYKRVHGNTLYALHKRGYIVRNDAACTPWWRRDYEITDAGRDALTTKGKST